MHPGFIYIVSVKIGGTIYHKIGKTDNTIQERIKALQTGCPELIQEVLYKLVANPYSLENFLHRQFNNNRTSGEWFNLTPNQIGFAISYITNQAKVYSNTRKAIHKTKKKYKYDNKIKKFRNRISMKIRKTFINFDGGMPMKTKYKILFQGYYGTSRKNKLYKNMLKQQREEKL